MDSGTAYGRPRPSYDATLVEVGAGTPAGEMLRRYWHPVGVAGDITTRPQKVRVLGEDLILFRDGKGRPGLLYPRSIQPAPPSPSRRATSSSSRPERA
jgi:hypothetical protein